MTQDKPSLSMGLDAILSLHGRLQTKPAEPIITEQLVYLPSHQLIPGEYQPRKVFSQQELLELAESLKNQGMLQPIIVRKRHDNVYEIIAGERRWRASQLAGMTDVPVIIKNITDNVACAFSLVENIQRKNLNALEEAMALFRLHHEFHLSHEKIAETIGRSRVAVTNSLRLLSLPENVKQYLMNESLSMGHARALISLDVQQQATVAEKIIKQALSVRQTEEWVRQLQAPRDTQQERRHRGLSQDRLSALTEYFGKVPSVKMNKQGLTISLQFINEEELADWYNRRTKH